MVEFIAYFLFNQMLQYRTDGNWQKTVKAIKEEKKDKEKK